MIQSVNATGDAIGGNTAAQRNVISNNNVSINLTNGVSDHIMQFNDIGINPSGTSATPNQLVGGDIDTNATGNLIADNLISGNGIKGIEIQDPTTAFKIIVRNKIGTNAASKIPAKTSEA